MNLVPLNDLRRHNMSLQSELEHAAHEIVASGWYVLGTNVKAFEAAFANYCGVAHCIGTGNGTDALELALRAVGVGAGSRVVTVANAGMYSTIAIRAAGAEPLFVDVDPDTLCMDVDSLAAALAQRPDAVIATHLYGRLADIGRIVDACAASGVALIEDCAQAHGAQSAGRKAGSFGALACFSFYPTKNLGALGDGGALVTSDDVLAERLRRLQQYGWGSKYVALIEGGRNSRLDELQAAFLRAKLPHLDAWNFARSEIAGRYTDGISHPRIRLQPKTGRDSVAHLYVVRTAHRDSLRDHLRSAGILTDIHYPVADHRQPCFGDRYAGISLQHTELACSEILTLPCFPEMTDAETQRVIDACNSWRP